MTETDNLVKRLPTEMGGLEGGRIQLVEHEYLPWEKRCHAPANVLDRHKIINTEEKRRGIAALGAELVEKLTYYEHWIVAFANILFEKQGLQEIEWVISGIIAADKPVDRGFLQV
jgi:Nitrile hydratase beta subunit